MRILQIVQLKREPGGEDFSCKSIRDQLAKSHSVSFAIFDSKDWLQAPEIPFWKQAAWMWHNPSSVAKLKELHQKIQPDLWIVHGIIPVASFAVYQTARSLRVPLLHYAHNFRPFSVNSYLWANGKIAPAGLQQNYWPEIWAGAWQNSRLKTLWLASLYWLAHRLHYFDSVTRWITVSDFIRDRFIEAGIPSHRISSLRHFFHPSPITNSQPEGNYYLYLGRLSEEKGISVLLQTWKILLQSMGKNCPRLIIGGSGPLENLIKTESAFLPIEWLGTVSGATKQKLISECRAMLAPSLWWEGLGLVTYEAYDQSRPMLAAASGGLQETVTDGITGRLHSPGNAEQLARQIQELEANPTLRHQMGASGRIWLQENASPEKWQEKFDAFLRQTIEAQQNKIAQYRT